MASGSRPWNLDQPLLLPPAVTDFVRPDHLANFVVNLVRHELDLTPILSKYSRDPRGAAPYHPGMMTALILYAYCRGMYSSRELSRACEERLDFMALTAMQQPDFRTISDFRKLHLEALKGLFLQILLLCRTAGLAKLGHVSLDGTKVKANASKHKAMSYGRMKQREPQLAAEVEEMLGKAEATDASEDAETGEARGDEMPEWAKNKQRQLEKIREAKAALEAEAQAEAARLEAERAAKQAATGKAPGGRRPKALEGVPEDQAQRNFTDPESRIMKTADGYVQGYNAQAAVDAASGVIVDQAVAARQNDAGELVPSVERIEANLGTRPKEVSADAGYFSEENAAAMQESGVRAYIATGRQKHHKKSAEGEETERGQGAQRKAMRARLRRGGHRSRYRLRKQTVEPVFGQIKEARGFRRFLLRGVANVQAEWALVCTAHNVLKLYSARTARGAA